MILPTLAPCAAIALFLATTVQALTIDTPSGLVSCLPTALTWKDATAPVYISAYPKGDTGADPYTLIKKLEGHEADAGTYSWKVNLAPGTVTTLGIRDATGATQASAPVTVRAPPAGTEDCDAIDPSNSGSGSSSTGSSGSSGSGNSGKGVTSGGSGGTTTTTESKNTTSTTGATNTADSDDPATTAGTSTNTTTTAATGNKNATTTATVAPATNDAPANLWVGSSEQNYIIIVSVLLSTTMAVMIGAWSE